MQGLVAEFVPNPVHPDGLSALLACQLIMAKAVMSIVKDDVLKAAGPLQVCLEAAIHAMREIFANIDIHGILLVDAANAFNSLHRKTVVHNMKFICLALATVLAHTYQSL